MLHLRGDTFTFFRGIVVQDVYMQTPGENSSDEVATKFTTAKRLLLLEWSVDGNVAYTDKQRRALSLHYVSKVDLALRWPFPMRTLSSFTYEAQLYQHVCGWAHGSG